MIFVINDDLKFSTLYDHYKESITFLKNDLNKRNKLSLKIFILVIIYFLLDIQQDSVIQTVNLLIKSKITTNIYINYTVLFVALSITILLTLTSYFKICINIERQYNYIHKCENKLNTLCNNELITREGGFYLKEYPLLSTLIDKLYKLILPITLILLLLIKIQLIVKKHYLCGLTLNISIISNIISIIMIFFYMLYLYKYIGWIKKINNFIKQILIKIHLYQEEKQGEE